MISVRIAICIVVLAAPLANAATIVTNTNILLSDGGTFADYALTVFQDAAGTDPTSVFFDYDGANVEVVLSNADEGSDWYRVDAGDEFSRQNIVDGLFTTIFAASSPNGLISVGSGNFFFGVNTGEGFGASGPNRDAFGWIELTNSAGELANVGNAMA